MPASTSRQNADKLRNKNARSNEEFPKELPEQELSMWQRAECAVEGTFWNAVETGKNLLHTAEEQASGAWDILSGYVAHPSTSEEQQRAQHSTKLAASPMRATGKRLERWQRHHAGLYSADNVDGVSELFDHSERYE